MKELASGRISDAEGQLRFETRSKLVGLLLLLASLWVMLSAGCGGDRVPADDSAERAASLAGDGQLSPVTFPRHAYPLGTDRGGDYFAGQLVLKEGCLLVEVPSDPTALGATQLVIWPRSFSLEANSGTLRVVDGHGRVVAQVGDHIRLNRAAVTYEVAKRRELVTGLPEHCPPANFLVGDEVTVFDPESEATELRLSDPEVLFFRQETEMSVNRVFRLASGVGELVLDGQCLRLNGGATILWPAGFSPHVEDGVVHVRNGAGRTIAKVGDEIAGGGGYFKSKHGECPGTMFRIHDVKVLPDVEVYFPRQDEALERGQVVKLYVGELVLNGKCLGVRVSDGSIGHEPALLVWPRAFELNVEDGAVEVIDANGRVAARMGDEVRFSAFNVTYHQAIKHGGLEEITPACSGPYLAVEEDFASTAVIGQCQHVETGRILEQVRDARDTLWDVQMLPGSPAGCAIPWEAAVETDGSSYILIVVDENGREISQKAMLREWVFHRGSRVRIETLPEPGRILRLAGYRWRQRR